jgi:hypothetical protein
MRLNKVKLGRLGEGADGSGIITGKEIWAGRSMTKLVEGADGSGINLSRLGEVMPGSKLPGGRRHAGRNQPPRPRA